MDDLDIRLKGYKANPGEAKKYTTPPCKLCGWAPNEEIHTNPKLHGKGPYHSFKSQ